MAVHGVVTNLAIVRTLPTDELAKYIIIYQTIFLMMNTLLVAFVFQPLMRFGAERSLDKGVAQSSILILCGVILVFLSFSALVAVFGDQWYGLHGLNAYAPAIPLLMFTFIPRLYFQHLYQSLYKVQHVFWINFSFAVISAGGILYLTFEGKLLTAWQVLAWLCGSSLLSSVLSIALGKPFWNSFRAGDRLIRSDMLRFGTLNLGSTGSFVLFGYLDNHLISLFCSPVEIAIYYSAKLLTRIYDVFSQIVQTALIPTLSRLYGAMDWITLRIVFEKAVCFSSIGLIPTLVIFLFFSDTIIALLFGGRFAESAFLLRIFAFLALLAPWNSVIASYYVAMDMLKTALWVNGLSLLLMSTSYFILIPLWQSTGTTLSVVIVTAIITLLNIVILKKRLHFRMVDVVRRTTDVINFIRNPKLDLRA
jgi:O-antigen/teichoic acid export membrane protein